MPHSFPRTGLSPPRSNLFLDVFIIFDMCVNESIFLISLIVSYRCIEMQVIFHLEWYVICK